MKTKRIAMFAVLALAIVALAVPLVGLGSRAASGPISTRALAPSNATVTVETPSRSLPIQEQALNASSQGRISEAVLETLGMKKLPKGTDFAKLNEKIAKRIKGGGTDVGIQSGEPATIMNSQSALSAALVTTIGGRDNQFSEVTLLADWDGREDCVADREQKQDDFSSTEPDIDFVLTRCAISEHTFANGFNENVIYYGDSVGNLWVGTDTNPGTNPSGNSVVDTVLQINIPTLIQTNTSGGVTLLNPQAGDCVDDQVVVTGIAVNPVSDLGDFGACNTIGEVVYVSVHDSEGCAATGANQPFRTRIFAFGFSDVAGGLASVGAIQILRNPLGNIAGVAVDSDSNLYFQLVDLVTFSGGAIFKVTETRRTSCATTRINRVIASIPSGLSGGIGLASAQGTATAPVLTAGGFRLTNYSGPSTTFGNIVAIASGQCNVLYAAVSRSLVGADDAATQATEGLFTNPSALGATPSMIISFADCSGGFDSCTSPAVGILGTLPVGDGIADVAASGLTRVSGVNNFRVFVLGNGPDIRPPAGGTSAVPGTLASVLRVDMQIDFQSHSGITVNEDGTVFVISGGAPGGPGKNPSPMVGEILCFEDSCPADRRADFVDLRGNGLPNPPASGGTVGDGDSDRFDHIFFVAPLDAVTLTPAGLSGLSRGFLLYTNRTRLRNVGTLASLPNGSTQGDDSFSGPLIFEDFDAGHQVAGGDDQNSPFRGDDDDGAGTPPLTGPLSGGFEFLFGAAGSTVSGVLSCTNKVWNGFFLNSNGNITFSTGDTSGFTDNSPTVLDFRSGPARIAPAWTDLNPNARAANPINFPAQALGFSNVNAFKIRYINVPQFGNEGCSTNAFGIGGNTFSVTLYDDGTGIDENANQPLNPANPIGNNADPFDLQEGPTDNRFTLEPNTGIVVPCPPRPAGTGFFVFDYCRMDLLGTDTLPVIVGYSIGGLSPLNPPGLCEINLSKSAAAADLNPFAVLPDSNNETANICANCLIGEGTEPTLFELFNEGSGPRIGSGGEITFATPDFDLRFEGNDPLLCTAIRQKDQNRGRVGFFGLTCPVNPTCLVVTPVGTVTVAPGQPAVGSAAAGSQVNSQGNKIATPTSGIINAICTVQLNMVGCGFFPNEVTTVCQGFEAETGQPLQRPGKTVSNALQIVCDTNGDGVPDTVIPLTSVTPISCNLVRGTLQVLSNLPGSAFPPACCGGLANFTLITVFTSGDNNIFGAFTRTTTCVIDLGVRAPVVFSVSPSNGDCRTTDQDLIITGACFVLPNGTLNVTSVFAVDVTNPANTIQAKAFQVVNPGVIDAHFSFGSANNGKTFLIFVSGPSGTSRNLTGTPPTNACVFGNEQGIQVAFKCDTPGGPGSGQTPDLAVVTRCQLVRDDAGIFSLDVFGTNIKNNASVTVGGQVPRKIKFRDLDTNTNTFTKISVKKKVCKLLTGSAAIVITNPGQTQGSVPFNCQERCPTN